MSIYKLSFKTANGEVVDLPAAMNKFTDINTLKGFANKHGYDTSVWNSNHGCCLKEFFSHATLKQLEIEQPLEEIDWNPFRQALQKEPALFSLPWDVFEKRIEGGILNAVLDSNNNLISTINALPKLINGLRVKLDIEDLDPAPQIYETGAGWAANSHRGLRMYTAFRRAVLQSKGTNQRLIFSQACGKGASNVNIKEGWTLVNPKSLPFASALMGWPIGDGLIGREFQLASGLKISLPKQGIYQGPSVSFTLKDGVLSQQSQKFLDQHKWSEFHHLWTSDFSKAKRLDAKLREGLGILEGENFASEIIQHTYRRWLDAIGKSLFYKKPDVTNNNETEIFQAPQQQLAEFMTEPGHDMSATFA